MKERFERPSIVRNVSSLGTKYGQVKGRTCMPDIEGAPVKDLVDQFGSPLFVFSERTIRNTYREALEAFQSRYPKTQLAWSYKTNYLDAVCSIFHSEGAWAEVVSDEEYEMARRLEVPGQKIVFNGPYKSRTGLRRAVAEGARIHIDNFEELCALEAISEELGREIDVGLRLNMDTGITPSWHRYGFNADNNDAWDIARRIQMGARLRLTGLHAHIGTFILDPSAYRTEVTKLAQFARRTESELGFEIAHMDIGGGFASKNTLLGQYSPGRDVNPSIHDYAEAATSAMVSAGFDVNRLPTLIVESGRALVDDSGYLIHLGNCEQATT
jgi:diaminopimelate decarboxylase